VTALERITSIYYSKGQWINITDTLMLQFCVSKNIGWENRLLSAFEFRVNSVIAVCCEWNH